MILQTKLESRINPSFLNLQYFLLYFSTMIAIAGVVLLICVLFFGIRRRLRQLPLPYYEGRHVVITGCDTGFGNMLAKELDARGLSVFAGCLTNNGEEELKKSCSRKLRTFPLDVSDSDSIKKALHYIKTQLPDDTGEFSFLHRLHLSLFRQIVL